ncbi:MAG: YafY family transcriptional regulator [Geodermatophilaceae bacterium]|nr:YafY family transcriptional regulator [Geodermatophilaceae bacterium]
MSTDRLPRLLVLVPYLQARPGVLVADVAADFGVTEVQLRQDLELLWMCGMPGHGPGDLIDLSFEGDSVTVTFDAGIHRPLRLTADEALSLLVALQTLAEVPGLAERDVVDRALAKIEAAAGTPAKALSGLTVHLQDRAAQRPGSDEHLAVLRQAVDLQRALDLTYYVAGRDETTQRIVDPMRLLLVEGRSYLEAWCRRSGDVRLFRLDRIDAVQLLAEPARVPEQALPRDVSTGVFQPSAEHDAVTLRLAAGARWVADYYPCERVTEVGPDLDIVLRVADRRWVRRLVLGLGTEVSVLDPPELAAEVRQEASAALAGYDRGIVSSA